MKEGFFRAAAVLALVLLSACDSENANSNTFQIDVSAQPAEGGRIDANPQAYARGDTVRLTATPAENFWFYAWEEDGVSLAQAPEIEVTAQSGLRLTAVFVPLPAALAVEPANLVVPEQTRIPMRAMAIADEAAPREVTALAQWESHDPEVADLDPEANGVLLSKSVGEASIQVEFGGQSAVARMHVVGPEDGRLEPAHDEVKLAQREATRIAVHFCYRPEAVGEAVGEARDDGWVCNIAPDAITDELAWSSDNPGVADVTMLDGEAVITGVAPGKASITATHGNEELEISVKVDDRLVDNLTIQPTELTLPVSGTAPLTVYAHSDGEEPWDVTQQVFWTVTTPDAVEVDAEAGRVVGKQPASGMVTAVMGEFDASVAVTVTAAPDAPGALTLVPRPNVILNDGKDSSRLIATIWPNDESAVIADGTEVIFDIPEVLHVGDGSRTTVNGLVELEVRVEDDGEPQRLTVGAEVADTVARAERALTIVDDLADIMITGLQVRTPPAGDVGAAGTGIVWAVLNTSNRDIQFDGIALRNGEDDISGKAHVSWILSAGGVLYVAELKEDIEDPDLNLWVGFTDLRTGKPFEVTEPL